MKHLLLLPLLLLSTVPAVAQDSAISIAEARASLTGSWRGELQYRDYQEDRWFGIPVTVEASLVGNAVTLISRASFDDGPARGTVYITSVEMLGPDGATEYAASFRADRAAELGTSVLSLVEATDAAHWVLLSEADGMDDDRPARIRETTTRDGDRLTTLKEVDFTDDDRDEWLVRNRTILEKTNA